MQVNVVSLIQKAERVFSQQFILNQLLFFLLYRYSFVLYFFSLTSPFPSPETSKVDYVLFQAATAIMEAVVREWILLEKTSIESLRAFLLTYVLQRPK